MEPLTTERLKRINEEERGEGRGAREKIEEIVLS